MITLSVSQVDGIYPSVRHLDRVGYSWDERRSCDKGGRAFRDVKPSAFVSQAFGAARW